MSRQAQVGMFSIAAIVLLIVVVYVLTNLGARTGYPLGIHFQSAAGLQNNAAVYFSGIQVGSVDRVKLLPDDSVDVIVSIRQGIGIPTASRFLIQAPVTGSPSLVIVPPHGGPTPYPTLAPGVAAIDKQPQGTNPATIGDLLQQGQGEIRRLDTILAALEKREPELLATAQSTLSNANEMTETFKTSVAEIAGMLRTDLGTAGANIAAMSRTLNSTMTLDAPRLSHMVAQLDETSVELNKSMAAIEGLATDPQLKENLLATTANVAETTEELKYVLADVRGITSDPQTQAHIRDAIANLDAVLQRAASIMAKLGGRSHVPGVDTGAPSPETSPSPSATPHALSGSERLSLGSALASIAHELIAIQIRVGELDEQQVCCPEPLFSADRGPQTDVNAVLLPHATTSVMFGANDIGQYTTWNLAALESVAPYARVGGGILYSRLGIMGQLGANGTGLDARFYDPRHPMLDLYGQVRIAPWADVFFGERALNQPWRRSDYGIEFRY
jgi:phospholipid/cholesterol/gamma-HCH transport system substrate-binding protein